MFDLSIQVFGMPIKAALIRLYHKIVFKGTWKPNTSNKKRFYIK